MSDPVTYNELLLIAALLSFNIWAASKDKNMTIWYLLLSLAAFLNCVFNWTHTA